MAIEKIRASRVNTITSTEYSGNQGLIWYDPEVGDLRIYAGGVPGGMLINGGGGNGSPGGSNGQVQFNNSGLFGGSANLTFNRNTGALSAVSFIGDGSQLTGLPAGYANSNVVAYGEAGWAGNIIPTGNGVYNLGSSSHQWGDLYVSNTTIYMNNVPITLTAENVLTVNGEALLSNDSDTSITTTGNITAGYFVGNGAALLSITGANVVGEVSNATYASSAVNAVTAETVSSSEQPNITGVGILSVLSVNGNVTANYFIGDGSQLTGIGGGLPLANGTSNFDIATANGAATITIDGTRTFTFGQGYLDIPKFGIYEEPGRIRGNGLQLRGDTNGGGSFTSVLLPNNDDAVGNAVTVGNDVGNVAIWTGGPTWTFDTAGALSLAGNVVTTANLTIKADNNNAWISQAAGDSGFSQLYWTSDIANADPYDGNGDFAWAYVDSGGFNVATNVVEPTENYNWQFNTDGVFESPGKFVTTPGNTSAVFDFHAPGGGDGGSDLEFGTDGFGTQYFVASVNDPSGQAMTFELTAVDEGNIEAQIRAQRGGDTFTWSFNGNGDLILPGNSAYIGSQSSQVNIYSDINTETAGITVQSNFSTNIFNEAVVNITTNAGDVPHQWQFDQTGNLTLPGSITRSGYNNPELLIANADPNWAYGFASDDNVNYYTQVKFFGDNSATRGFKILDVNSSNAWVFDGQGIVTLPGEGIIRSIDDTVALQSLNTTTGNANSVYLGSSGGLGFSDQAIGGNWLEIFRNDAEPEIRVPVGRGNLNLQTAEGENSYNWTFGKDGTTTFPGNNINSGSNPITLWSTDSSSLLWRDAAGGAPSEPVQTIIEAGNGAATITVATGVLAVQSQKIWTFDTAGNTVFPDTTVQTTAYPGTANTLSLIGNITGDYILGNGSQLTGLPATYGNSNVAANLAAFGSNPISTTGNITAGYFIGNGSALSSIAGANVTGTVANATYATSAGSATTAATVTTNAQPNITSVGTLTSVSVTGNTTSGNLLTGGLISATGNINGSNLVSTGAVYSNYNTNAANTASFNATGGNTLGGTGYLDFMVVRNTSGGATNPYKWFRVNSIGGLEIINSAYSATIFSLSDAGVMNVSSPYQVAGKQAVNGPAFSAYPTSPAQTITSGSQQRVNLGNEVYDIGGCFDAPNGRFTPNVEGYYQFEGTVRIDGSSGTGEYMITVWKNGAEYKRGTNGSGTEIGASFFPLQVSCQAYANGSTDYFELYVQQGSGSDRTISVFQQISYFQGCMIRGA